jgi:uncharacterized protein (TIGR03032 family)
VPSGETVLRDLSMPHSPRLYQGQLYLLDSGHGSLIRLDPLSGERSTVAVLPGFTQGLDCFAGHAFVGLSQIRETAVFGGLPIQRDCGERSLLGLQPSPPGAATALLGAPESATSPPSLNARAPVLNSEHSC